MLWGPRTLLAVVVVERARCVHVCTRLRPCVDRLAASLLVDEESGLVQQVHAVCRVEESVYMEASAKPAVHR